MNPVEIEEAEKMEEYCQKEFQPVLVDTESRVRAAIRQAEEHKLEAFPLHYPP